MTPARALALFAVFFLFLFVVSGELIVRVSMPLLRAQSPAYYYRPYMSALTKFDDRFIWRGRPGAQAAIRNSEDREVQYELQAGGWREDGHPAGGVLVLGDSFTFGTGVAAEERFGVRAGDVLGVHVFHAGVMGWAPDQYRIAAGELLPKAHWRAMVVQLSNNDLSDVAGHVWLEESVGRDGSLPEKLGPARRAKTFRSWSEFRNLLVYLGVLLSEERLTAASLEEALPRFERALDDTLEQAVRAGVPAVMLMATDWGVNAYGPVISQRYEKTVRELAARRKVPLLLPHAHVQLADLLPFPDLHWRAETHRRVGDELAQVIRRLPAPRN